MGENTISERKNTVSEIKQYVYHEANKKRFEDMLGKKAASYMSSIISAVSDNSALQKVDSISIMQSAFIAASLDLPINPNLGFAYIIPYGGKAQFQMGWKGFVQLAMRTGQYKTINTTPIFEGQLKGENPLTGEYLFDFSIKSEKVIGYAAYFKMINGFEKTLYMTKEECEKHAKKYSKTYVKNDGQWVKDFDLMAQKTVIKLLLSKYGMLTTEMQNAVTFDQSIIKDAQTGEHEYIDSNENHTDSLQELKQRVSELIELTTDKQKKAKLIQEVIEAETSGKNTVEFYHSIIEKIENGND